MSKNNFMGTLFVGTAAAITALLFAPKSGRELRADLKKEALSLQEQAMDKVNQFTDEIKETYHEVEEEINYTNPDLAETMENIEDDLYTTNVKTHGSDVVLHSSNLKEEDTTTAPDQEYPPIEDLETPMPTDFKIDDKRGQI
ncbi:MAG: YtxH domain-containing protein [Carnobacterium sp.]|uniref:YtxH domain-containing protein n=1 Tax=Carnobacterium antarcticum TaxID=2126436 RepID=A0ABW4NJE7_9LACT|nr:MULTISPECIES: YtxH domain-containing protein [unclassified Carnobacterium]ALV22368.1 hypothetical protein NY10_1770 [Carnobacterium sp. CP1]QQP70303.1 YtxH domain-containing protein [Carnobacterium sp. CS13]